MDIITLKPYYLDRMSDEEFFRFCQANKNLKIERNGNLGISIMSPAGSRTSLINAAVLKELLLWNDQHQLGFVFESSGGFTLPDRSVLSPDASWLSRQRWMDVPENDKDLFAPVCPEFVVEIRSKSDRLEYLQQKMERWIGNGAQLAWLVDPLENKVHVYSKGNEIVILDGFDQTLEAGDLLPGFKLDLTRLKAIG